MSITDIQHAALGDAGLNLAAQSAMETAWANFQIADQALTQIQYTGVGASFPLVGANPVTTATTTRTNALSAFKTLAAALT